MASSPRVISQILSMNKFAAVIPAGLALALAACTPQSPTAAPGSSPMASTSSAAPSKADGKSISIVGAGASAPDPLYQRWFKEYNKKNPTVQISYQSVGSGAGIKQFINKTVDFGATDSALKKEEKEKVPAERGPAIQVPSTGLFVVFAYNLDGVKGLKLSRESFCAIADGSISKWNDEKIKKDNAGATLPDTDITFAYRSEGSGTTSIFTKHIERACPNWKAGSGKTVEWPKGQGAKGNEGVTALIKQTKGAIGYTEYSYAKDNGLDMATLQNKAGEFIVPTPDAAAKALTGVKVPDDFAVSVPDPEAKDAYPIVSLTWLLFYSKYEDAAKADALKAFTKWALTDGKAFSTELGYIPLPEELVTKVNTAVDAVGK